MGKWNRANFKVITIALDVWHGLKALKQSGTDSFNDILRRLLMLAEKDKELGWSFVVHVTPNVKAFWEESGLF